MSSSAKKQQRYVYHKTLSWNPADLRNADAGAWRTLIGASGSSGVAQEGLLCDGEDSTVELIG